MLRTIRLAVSVTLLIPALACAAARIECGDQRHLDISYLAQFWCVATMGAAAADGAEVDDRLDFMLRRGRLDFRGRIDADVTCRIQFAFDKLGKDAFDAVPGTPQAPGNLDFYLFDLYATYRLRADWLYLTAGYFRPQVSFESIVSPHKVPSLDKSLVNALVREHLVGRSQGRETGIDLGGRTAAGTTYLCYHLGLFDTNHGKILGNAAAGGWAPLWTARLSAGLGDPPRTGYGLGCTAQFFRQRRGLTLSVDGSYQGATNQTRDGDPGNTRYSGGFRRNMVYGGDLLANYDGWNLSMECRWLHREFDDEFVAACDALTGPHYDDVVWHVRGSYEIPLPGKRFLEPAVMFSRFAADRHSSRYPSGLHEQLSCGLNWYLDRHRHRISIHYVAQDGEPVSRYAKESGRLGDYLGVGVQLTY